MKKLTIILNLLLISFTSCEKSLGQEDQSALLAATDRADNIIQIPASVSSSETMCIVIRHAEKENAGSDPNLSSEGKLRAEELKNLLKEVDVNTIYTTAFKRTRQTAVPLADDKGITITEYDAYQPVKKFAENVLLSNRGKIVVIVGHSDTVPEIVKALSNNTSTHVSISDSQYDNLFIVNNSGTGTASVIHKKYGKSTP
jgi:broad specificity phosphatase PhoE